MASPIVFGIGKYRQPDFDDVSQQMGSFLGHDASFFGKKSKYTNLLVRQYPHDMGSLFVFETVFWPYATSRLRDRDPQYAAEPQLRKNMHDILSSASSAICAHPKFSAFVWIACCWLHAIAVEAFFLNTFSELGVL